MTKDAWIARARELLAGNDDAAQLLAVDFELEDQPATLQVIEGEVIEDGQSETPGKAVARIEPVVLRDPGPHKPGPPPARRGFATRFGGMVKQAAEALAESDEEAPLSGFDRLDVRMGETAERAVDKGLDALKDIPKHAPSLRDRGAAFRGRKLGRQKP